MNFHQNLGPAFNSPNMRIWFPSVDISSQGRKSPPHRNEGISVLDNGRLVVVLHLSINMTLTFMPAPAYDTKTANNNSRIFISNRLLHNFPFPEIP